MKTQSIEYEADGLQMIGHLAWTASEPRPAVLVFPDASGLGSTLRRERKDWPLSSAMQRWRATFTVNRK